MFRIFLWSVIAFAGLAIFQFSKNVTKVFTIEGMPITGIQETTASHLQAGRWNDALDELIPSIDQGDEDPNIKYIIARCHKELGLSAYNERRYDDALAHFEEGLWHVEDDTGLQLSLAVTYLTIADYEHAETAYERLLALDPNNLQALKELGELYYLTSEPDKSEILWSQAVALDPKDARLKKRLSTLRKQLASVEAFNVDENLHFTIRYDGVSMPQLEYAVLEIMEEAYYDIGSRLHIYPKRQISVTLMTGETFFDITGSPEWTSGIYEGQIKIPVAGAGPGDLEEVLFHEFVHAVLFDQLGKNCPWWFNEGLAQYLSDADGGGADTRKKDSKDASFRHDVRLSEYAGVSMAGKEAAARAYASALSAVRHLVNSYGEPGIERIIESLSDGKSFESAFWIATGYSFEEFEDDWKRTGINNAPNW